VAWSQRARPNWPSSKPAPRRQLRSAADYTSRLQLLGEKRSDQIALPLLIGSSVALPFLGPSSAFAILFSAPANSIRGTASLATSSHLTAITHEGVLVKDGRALEALAGVDTFLFDKTGTLTSDDLLVTAVVSSGTWSREQILARAASAEAGLSHPLAKALIHTAAVEVGSDTESEPEHSSFRVGYGVVATVSGGESLLLRFLAATGATPRLFRHGPVQDGQYQHILWRSSPFHLPHRPGCLPASRTYLRL